MSKSQQIIDLLTKSPDLTVDEIAEKLGFERTKAGALVSSLRGEIVGETFEGGGNAKRYRVASTPPPQGRQTQKREARQETEVQAHG